MKKLSYLNDEIFKRFISLEDEASFNFTKQFIYLITNIKVDSLQKQDREFDREFDGTKRSHVDFLARANGQIFHIEIQKYMAHPALLPRIQLYQARALSSQRKKGKAASDYDKVISIVLYEDIYENDDYLVSYYEYSNRLRESDPFSKLSMYLVELGKINYIYQSKGLDKMDKLEKICFAIKNSDNEAFSDILKVIEENEDEVRYMKEKYDLFEEGFLEELAEFMADVDAANERQYFELKGKEEGKAEGLKEGKIEGIKEGRNEALVSTLKILIKTKFNEDASWIDHLPTSILEEMTPYLVSDISYEQLKQKFSI